ncbi:hypothetical protein ALC56_12001 [Trachymyrmex septentrionalis]|uniref:Uncharacterized protein n=1 Tax=Trachymyrmex septentrionalis TaxID=34720 RepID=A0A195EZU2_9HYME|nr:hypothetical protein ALC56_12001 [Trachymyrmex septentrionalis]
MYIFLSPWQDLKEPVLPILDLFTTQLVFHILQRHKFHVYSKIFQILSALFTPFNRNQSICCTMILNKWKEDIAKQPAMVVKPKLYSYYDRIIRIINILITFSSVFFFVLQIPAVSSQFGSCDHRFRDYFVLQVFCFISLICHTVINTNALRRPACWNTQRHGYPSNVIENSGIPSHCIPEYQDKNGTISAHFRCTCMKPRITVRARPTPLIVLDTLGRISLSSGGEEEEKREAGREGYVSIDAKT